MGIRTIIGGFGGHAPPVFFLFLQRRICNSEGILTIVDGYFTPQPGYSRVTHYYRGPRGRAPPGICFISTTPEIQFGGNFDNIYGLDVTV